jgi:hypothetical protein
MGYLEGLLYSDQLQATREFRALASNHEVRPFHAFSHSPLIGSWRRWACWQFGTQ